MYMRCVKLEECPFFLESLDDTIRKFENLGLDLYIERYQHLMVLCIQSHYQHHATPAPLATVKKETLVSTRMQIGIKNSTIIVVEG